MPQTDLDAPLWFESQMEDRPNGVYSREDLVEIETEEVEWNDAKVRARFEVLVSPWGASRTVCSTAFARPLGAEGLPWIALGSHKSDGPRLWQGGGAQYNDVRPIARHLRRALPALLGRRLWGRVLWLDRELNLADETSGVLRLYLGAKGQGEWFLPRFSPAEGVRAGFDWADGNRVARLLESSDEALLQQIYVLADAIESDLSFSLNWVSWGGGGAANDKRSSLNFCWTRGSLGEMSQILRWAIECEPTLSEARHVMWSVNPLSPNDLNRPGSEERFYNGESLGFLPPLSRRIRDWAHQWFGATLNQELRARHRCMVQSMAPIRFVIHREGAPSAHQQLEAFAQLRDFLSERVSPDELQTLLKLDERT